MKKIHYFIWFLFFAQTLFSQSWKEANDSVMHYFNNEEYEKAFVWAEKEVAAAEKEFGKGHQYFVVSLKHIVILKDKIGNKNIEKYLKEVEDLAGIEPEGSLNEKKKFFTELIDLFKILEKEKQILQIQDKAIEINKKYNELYEKYQILVPQFDSLYKKAKYEEAEEVQKKVISLVEKLYGKNHFYYTVHLDKLSSVYVNTQNIVKFEQVLIEINNIYRQLFKGDDSTLAKNIYDFASFYYSRGDTQKVEILLNEALEMRRRIFINKDHPDLANSISSMGIFYNERNDTINAEKLLNEALEMRRRIFINKDHPDLANSINDLAAFYFLKGNYGKSEPLMIEALEMRRRIFINKDHPDLAQSISYLGRLYYNKEDYINSEHLFIEALNILRGYFKEDNIELATSICDLGNLYFKKNDYIKAEKLLIEALDMKRRILKKENPLLIESIYNLGMFYFLIGDYIKAEYPLIEVLEIGKKIFNENQPELASYMNSLGHLYSICSIYSKAEPLLIKALEMRRKIYKSDNLALSISIGNLASLYLAQSNYKKGESLLIEALEMQKRLFKEDHSILTINFINLAFLYLAQGNYKKGESLLIEALEMQKRLFKEDHSNLALIINNLGVFYSCIGNYTKAESFLIEALDMRRRILKGDHLEIANSMENLSALYLSQCNYIKAELLLNETLEMKKRILKGKNSYLCRTLSNLGCLYTEQKNYTKAEQFLIEALEMSKRLSPNGHSDYLATRMNNLASLYQIQGKYPEAEPLYIEALEMYKSIFLTNSTASSEKEREQLWNTMNYNYEIFHSFALKRKAEKPEITETAFNNLLFTKALQLNTSKKIREIILNSGDNSLILKFENWLSVRQQINFFSQKTAPELEKSNINLAEFENRANSLEKELALLSHVSAKATDKTIYSWQDVQTALKPNEAAIEFVRVQFYDKRWTDTVYYFAYIIKKDSKYPDLVVLENGNEIEEEIFPKYSDIFKVKRGEKIDNGKWKIFYNKIWKPIKEKLSGVSKLYISNDGGFNRINISAFYNPETNKFLFQEYDIVYLISTKDIINQKSTTEQKNVIALFGRPKYDLNASEQNLIAANSQNLHRSIDKIYDNKTNEAINNIQLKDLPETEVEVKKIDTLARNNKYTSLLKLKEYATEEEVKQLKNPYILHLSTHGYFLSTIQIEKEDSRGLLGEKMFGFETMKFYQNPLLRSGLMLAGAENTKQGTLKEGLENGILTADEVSGLYLDETELVVLSACETGLGDVRNGEGVFGLQRAFIHAGAKYLLMSLCQVPDFHTQLFMTTFYNHLFSIKNVREAFNLTREEIYKMYPEPLFWASFVLIGK